LIKATLPKWCYPWRRKAVPKTSTAIHALPYLQAPKFLAKANARMLAVLILFNGCNRISDKKKKSIMVNRFRSKSGKEP
jgi:hypothetical protein